MKEVIILKPFRDKDAFYTLYSPGEKRHFDDDRAAALAALGLAEELGAPEAKAPEVAEVTIPMKEDFVQVITTVEAETQGPATFEELLSEPDESQEAPQHAEETATKPKRARKK